MESVTSACLNAGDHTRPCIYSIGLLTTHPSWQEVISRSFKGDLTETAVHLCDRFPVEYLQECYLAGIDNIMSFGIINLEQASEFCMASNAPSECFKQIGDNIGLLVVDNDQYEQVCNNVPDEFKDDCMGQSRELQNKNRIHTDQKNEILKLSFNQSLDSHIDKDQKKETRLILFVRDSLQKIQILVRASFELIRYELFFSNSTGEKTINTPNKTLKPEQNSEQLLYDDDVMDEMIKTNNETGVTTDVHKTDNAVIRYVNGEYVPNTVHIISWTKCYLDQ